jgi:hypothetical protein
MSETSTQGWMGQKFSLGNPCGNPKVWIVLNAWKQFSLFDAPNNSASKFFAAVVEGINRPLLPFDHASNA